MKQISGRYLILLRGISLFVAGLIVLESLVFADPAPVTYRSTLAPPLSTGPICEPRLDADGLWEVVTNEQGLPSADFQKRWMITKTGFLIAHSLRHQISRHSLVPRILLRLEEAGILEDILADGYDINNISETRLSARAGRSGRNITEFILPVKRAGTPAYGLKFSFTRGKGARKIYSYTEGPAEVDIFISRVVLPAPDTGLCDSDNELVTLTAESIVQDVTHEDGPRAQALADWVYYNIPYAMGHGGYWDAKASETLHFGQGMCFNISNLFIAMARALGMRAEFGVVQVHKEAFKNMVPPERYQKMADLSEHIFARVMVDGKWKIVDLAGYARSEGPVLRPRPVFSGFALKESVEYRENIDELAFYKASKETREERDRYFAPPASSRKREPERTSAVPRPYRQRGVSPSFNTKTSDFQATRIMLRNLSFMEVTEDTAVRTGPGEEGIFAELVECKGCIAVNAASGERLIAHFLPRGFEKYPQKPGKSRETALEDYLSGIFKDILEESPEDLSLWDFYIVEGPFSAMDAESVQIKEIKKFLVSLGVPGERIYEFPEPGAIEVSGPAISSKFIIVDENSEMSIIVEESPKGSPATLLMEMYHGKVYADNTKTRKDLQLARRRNNSKTTLLSEIKTLSKLGILEGGREGYYLSSWVKGIRDIESFIERCPGLEKRVPGEAEMAAIRKTVQAERSGIEKEHRYGGISDREERAVEDVLQYLGALTSSERRTVFARSGVLKKVIYEIFRLHGMDEPRPLARVIRSLSEKGIVPSEMSADLMPVEGDLVREADALSAIKDEEKDIAIASPSDATESFLAGIAYRTPEDKENFRYAISELLIAGRFREAGEVIIRLLDKGEMSYLLDSDLIDDFIRQGLSGYDPYRQAEAVLEKLVETGQLSYVDDDSYFLSILDGLLDPDTVERGANIMAMLIKRGQITYKADRAILDPFIEMCISYSRQASAEKLLIALVRTDQIRYAERKEMFDAIILSMFTASDMPFSPWRLINELIDTDNISYGRDRSFLRRFLEKSSRVSRDDRAIPKVMEALFRARQISYQDNAELFDMLFDRCSRSRMAEAHADLIELLIEEELSKNAFPGFYGFLEQLCSDIFEIAVANIMVHGSLGGGMDVSFARLVYGEYASLRDEGPLSARDVRTSSVMALVNYLSSVSGIKEVSYFPTKPYLHAPVEAFKVGHGAVSANDARSVMETEILSGRVVSSGDRYYLPVRNPFFYFGEIHNRSLVFDTGWGDIVYKGAGLSHGVSVNGLLTGLVRGMGINVLYGGLPECESSAGLDALLRDIYARLKKKDEPFIVLAEENGADIDVIRFPVAEASLESFPVFDLGLAGDVLEVLKSSEISLPRTMPVIAGMYFPALRDLLGFLGITDKDDEYTDPVVYVYKVPVNRRFEEISGVEDLAPFFGYYGHDISRGVTPQARRGLLISAAARFAVFIRMVHEELGGACYSDYGTVFSDHNANPLTIFDYDTIRLSLEEWEKEPAYKKDTGDAEELLTILGRILSAEEAEMEEAISVFRNILEVPRKKTDIHPPRGSPATLLRYMMWNGVFRDPLPGESGPYTQKEMANKRGGNDSPATISREVSVLRRAGLVEGLPGEALYLPEWMRGIKDIDGFIRDCTYLDLPSPSLDETREIGVRVAELKQKILSNTGESEDAILSELKQYVRLIEGMFDWLMSAEYGENYHETNCYGAAHVLSGILDERFYERGIRFSVRETDYFDRNAGELRWIRAELPAGRVLMISAATEKGKINVWDLEPGILKNGLARHTELDPDGQGLEYDHGRIERVKSEFFKFSGKKRYDPPAFGVSRNLPPPVGLKEETPESAINRYTVYAPGSVMKEAGMLHCNTLFVYDMSTGIGASSHVSLAHFRELSREVSRFFTGKAVDEIVNEMVLLGAERDSLKFAVVRRCLLEAGEEAEEYSLGNQDLLSEAVEAMGFEALRITVSSDSATCDLSSGKIFDGKIRFAHSFKPVISHPGHDYPGGAVFSVLEQVLEKNDFAFVRPLADMDPVFSGFNRSLISEIKAIRQQIFNNAYGSAHKNDVDVFIKFSEQVAQAGEDTLAILSFVEEKNWGPAGEGMVEMWIRQGLYDIAYRVLLYYGKTAALRSLLIEREKRYPGREYNVGNAVISYLGFLLGIDPDGPAVFPTMWEKVQEKTRLKHQVVTSKQVLRLFELADRLPDGMFERERIRRFVESRVTAMEPEEEWTPLRDLDPDGMVNFAVWCHMELGGHEMNFLSEKRLAQHLYLHKPSRRLFFSKIYAAKAPERAFPGHTDHNDPEREYAAYVLGRALGVNTAETLMDETGRTFSLLPISTSGDDLPNLTWRKANSASFVFNVLVRKWDDSLSMVQRSGVKDTFISFDHDAAFDPQYIDNERFFRVFTDFSSVRGQKWTPDKFDRGTLYRTIKTAEELDIDAIMNGLEGRISLTSRESFAVFLKRTQKTIRDDVKALYERLAGEQLFVFPEEGEGFSAFGNKQMVRADVWNSEGIDAEAAARISEIARYALERVGIEISLAKDKKEISPAREGGLEDLAVKRGAGVTVTFSPRGLQGVFAASRIVRAFVYFLGDCNEERLAECKRVIDEEVLRSDTLNALEAQLDPDSQEIAEVSRIISPADDTARHWYGENVIDAEGFNSMLEEERLHAVRLADAVNGILACAEHGTPVVALGTSWIPGYEKGQLQYTALNPLISSIREHLDRMNIPFIVGDDNDLPALIQAAKNEKGMSPDTKVIALTGVTPSGGLSGEFERLVTRDNYTIVGVDASELAVVGLELNYVRLLEMLVIAINCSAGISPSLDNMNINILPPDPAAGRLIYILTPRAEHMDYELLRNIYSVQRYA